MDAAKIKQTCVGLDIFAAKNRLFSLYPDLKEDDIEITYQESDYRRFIVTDCKLLNDKKVMLYATSKNAVRYLPSNFQENDFLSRYLMIFQHLKNDISIKIDNINELFRPMHCPSDFLQVLADWLGINVELLGTEETSMELTSPGIEHNLKNAAEFALFAGRPVRIWDKTVTDWISGTIVSADDKSVTLKKDDGTEFTQSFENIAKAKFISASNNNNKEEA